MISLVYVEDVFLTFYKLIKHKLVIVDTADISAILSIAETLENGSQITKKQSFYILRLLQTYQTLSEEYIPNINSVLETPVWRSPFREIDTSRRLSLFIDDQRVAYILAKFPFAFKDTFVKEFVQEQKIKTSWDPELKVQRIKLLDVNIISFVDIANRYKFEIDHNIIAMAEQVEEIWDNEDSYIPHCVVEKDQVFLKNASTETQTYFNDNKKQNLPHDLMLAKSMGYCLKGNCSSTIEKIASSPENKFWVRTNQEVINLLAETNQYPALIILDRASDSLEWTKQFVKDYTNCNLPSNDVKVCYRLPNTDTKGKLFNDWIKENSLGKDLVGGKIFICLHKPPKWAMRNDFKAKAVITNGIYPSMNAQTNALIEAQSLVVHVCEIRPSEKRNNKIVEL
jgi:hypothetical protein